MLDFVIKNLFAAGDEKSQKQHFLHLSTLVIYNVLYCCLLKVCISLCFGVSVRITFVLTGPKTFSFPISLVSQPFILNFSENHPSQMVAKILSFLLYQSNVGICTFYTEFILHVCDYFLKTHHLFVLTYFMKC